MQSEDLQHLLRVREHLLQLVIAVLGFHDLHQLDLVELMHANHPARAHARRARFRAEARAVGAVVNRKLAGRENLLAMDVRDRRLGRREQIQLAQRGLVQTFAHGVSLILKLRKLSHAHHAVAADDVRRRDFGVAVLGRVQIQQELDQRPFQPRAPVRVEQEAAAGKLRPPREVHELERLAQLDVRLGIEGELGLGTPVLYFGIVGAGFAQRHAGVRGVRQADEDGVACGLGVHGGLVERGYLVAERARLGLLGFRLGQLLLAHQGPDLLGDLVAQGLQILDLLERRAPLLVELEHLVNPGVVPAVAGGEPLFHQFRLLPNPFDVNHAACCREGNAERQGASGEGSSIQQPGFRIQLAGGSLMTN